MLVGFLGPWVFDLINVPAEYACHPPNYRLYGDFCGSPLTGAWVVWMMGSETIRSLAVLATGSSDSPASPQLIYISLLVLLLNLPLISTLFTCLRPANRRLAAFHIAVCVLAGGVGLVAGLSSYPRLFFVVWGVWLYILACAAAVVLEVVHLRGRETPVLAG
jgi:hypothetical protein